MSKDMKKVVMMMMMMMMCSTSNCRPFIHGYDLAQFQELERLRAEKRDMSKDMKKMMRQHAKLLAKMAESDPELPRLLEMVAVLVSGVTMMMMMMMLRDQE